MRLFIIGVVAAVCLLVGGPSQVERAEAHRKYCGHTVLVWQVWSYGTAIDYKEDYGGDYTSGGVHMHVHRTYWRSVTASFDPWHLIHEHHASCGALPA